MPPHTARAAGPAVAADASPVDRALLEEWALSYLGRYASSAGNLRRVLQRRMRRRPGIDAGAVRAAEALIDDIVARYRAAGLIDDAAYAAARARRELAHGRSLRRIAAGLAQKGVARAEAAAALAALRDSAADPELAAACAFARRRRLGPFRAAPRERRRELAAFARAGFGQEVARAVLACADEAAIEELLASAAGEGEV